MKNIYKELQTIFLTSTISATILIGIEEYILFQLQPSTIIISLLGGLIIGICLSLFGRIFIKYTSDLRQVTIIQVFSITLISLIISVLIIFTSSIFPHENWVEISRVPGAIEKFIPEHNSIELRVQTKIGNIYKYECKYSYFSFDDCKWQLDNSFIQKEQEISNDLELKDYYFFSPIPPIKPVESLQSYTLYPDAFETAKFIRSANGRIFIWHRLWNPLDAIVQELCGLIIGLLVGTLTNIVVFLTRKRKSIGAD